jgi:hypothetical protein
MDIRSYSRSVHPEVGCSFSLCVRDNIRDLRVERIARCRFRQSTSQVPVHNNNPCGVYLP